MADILRTVLTEFWPFIAALMLIGALGDAIADIVKAFRRKRGES